MKKPSKRDEMRAEYSFKNGRRGRYAERYAEGTNTVRLDADVAAVFSSSEAVNDALRKIATSSNLTQGSMNNETTGKQAGLDRRHRDSNSQIRQKRGDTLVGTLRDQYGDDFLPGFRGDMRLDAVLKKTNSTSLSELLEKAKRAQK